MKLKLITVALIYGLLSCKQSEISIAQGAIPATQNEIPMSKETIYQFKVEDLEGNIFDFFPCRPFISSIMFFHFLNFLL